MHQAIRQFTVGGEQQQTTGVDVKTSNRNPTSAAQFWQTIKNGRTAFRIVTRAQLTFWFVIRQHTADLFSGLFYRDKMTVDANFQRLGHFNAIAQRGNFAVYADAACFDDGFDFTAGAVASSRQHFL